MSLARKLAGMPVPSWRYTIAVFLLAAFMLIIGQRFDDIGAFNADTVKLHEKQVELAQVMADSIKSHETRIRRLEAACKAQDGQ